MGIVRTNYGAHIFRIEHFENVMNENGTPEVQKIIAYEERSCDGSYERELARDGVMSDYGMIPKRLNNLYKNLKEPYPQWYFHFDSIYELYDNATRVKKAYDLLPISAESEVYDGWCKKTTRAR